MQTLGLPKYENQAQKVDPFMQNLNLSEQKSQTHISLSALPPEQRLCCVYKRVLVLQLNISPECPQTFDSFSCSYTR